MAAQRTPSRVLGSALVGYLVLTTCVITLAPFRFRWPERFGFWYLMPASDLVINLLLLAPLGFVHALARGAEAERWPWASLRLGLAFSALLEGTQQFIDGRYSSPIDVATNGFGAWFGALVYQRLQGHLRARLADKLALELPLMGLLYLLVPLQWIAALAAGAETARLLLLPLLAAVGGIILVSVWRHRLAPAAALTGNGVAVAAAVWFLVGTLPALPRRPLLLGAVAAGLALSARLAVAWLPPPAGAERRFELPTLRLCAPVYLVYLVVSSLAAVNGGASWAWRWTLPRLPDLQTLFRLVEAIIGFSVAGYMLAEARGRRSEPRGRSVVLAACTCLGGAAALEVARAVWSIEGGIAIRVPLAAVAGTFGAIIYRSQLAVVLERSTTSVPRASGSHGQSAPAADVHGARPASGAAPPAGADSSAPR